MQYCVVDSRQLVRTLDKQRREGGGEGRGEGRETVIVQSAVIHTV